MAFARLRHRLFGRPDVVTYFTLENGHLHLAVENAGSRPAHDVAVSFDLPWDAIDRLFGPVRTPGRTPRSPLGTDEPVGPFETIGFLPADKTVRTALGPADRYFAAEGKDRVESTVSFAGGDGETFTNRALHTLDTLGRVRYSMDNRVETRGGVEKDARGGSRGHAQDQ